MKISSISNYQYKSPGYKKDVGGIGNVNKSNIQPALIPNVPYYSIAFKGDLLGNMKVGKEILGGFLEKYPDLKSSYFMNVMLENYRLNPKYKLLVPQLEKEVVQCAEKIDEIRQIVFFKPQKDYDMFIKMLKVGVTANGCANCGEVAYIMQANALSRKIPSDIINLDIFDKATRRNKFSHAVMVLGLDKNADKMNPSTWNEGAVIVDGLLKKVFPAKDAAFSYHKMLKLEPDRHTTEVMDGNIINTRDYISSPESFKNVVFDFFCK